MGRGTGLGLATVYGIVKQNKGHIDVYSEPGQGTTFNIYLPRYEGGQDYVKKETADEYVPLGHETILLVEDEIAILNMTTMMLMHLGYTVLAASSPGEAIHLAEQYASDKIHMLITDVIMPGMNGQALARTLLSQYPHIKSLFMSGYTPDVIAGHGVMDEGMNFIRKPFSIKDLATKIREVLDK
jgi:CheY-like chemotaxis protein